MDRWRNISSKSVYIYIYIYNAALRRYSHHARCCLPLAVGRPAEGGVASLRPWQIAIYEQWVSIVKKRHVTFALFASSPLYPLSLFLPPPSVLSTFRSLPPRFSWTPEFFSSPHPPVIFLLPRSLSPRQRSPFCANRMKLFADNFAERKSRRVRLLSEPSVVRLYRFLRWLLVVSSVVKR